MIIMERLMDWELTGMRKPAPAPLFPSQIPHDLTQDWTLAAAVGRRRPTAGAITLKEVLPTSFAGFHFQKDYIQYWLPIPEIPNITLNVHYVAAFTIYYNPDFTFIAIQWIQFRCYVHGDPGGKGGGSRDGLQIFIQRNKYRQINVCNYKLRLGLSSPNESMH
jgi:hypothetical protein